MLRSAKNCDCCRGGCSVDVDSAYERGLIRLREYEQVVGGEEQEESARA